MIKGCLCLQSIVLRVSQQSYGKLFYLSPRYARSCTNFDNDLKWNIFDKFFFHSSSSDVFIPQISDHKIISFVTDKKIFLWLGVKWKSYILWSSMELPYYFAKQCCHLSFSISSIFSRALESLCQILGSFTFRYFGSFTFKFQF